MTETCTIEVIDTTLNFGLVRHGLSVELMLMGVRNPEILEHEFNLFKLLADRYPTSPYFLKPVRCDAEGAFYRDYKPQPLETVRAEILRQYRPVPEGPTLETPKVEEISKTDETLEILETLKTEETLETLETPFDGMPPLEKVSRGGNVSSASELATNKLPPHQQIWQYVIEIATAMKYLHDAGIIHRNLCLTTISVDKTILLADLISAAQYVDGVAKPPFPPMFAGAIHPETSKYKVINHSSIHKLFTAPEASEHPDKFSPASDMYAFGLLIHYLITGVYPPGFFFDPVHMQEEIRKRNENNPEAEFPAVNLFHIPEFGSLITDCLYLDPNLRPQFNEEFIARLERIGTVLAEQPLAWWLGKVSKTPVSKPTVSTPISRDLMATCKLL